mgnify:CR=1 FL=1
MTAQLSAGVCHLEVPEYFQELLQLAELVETWESLTSLARNEFLCWMTAAKQQVTNDKRMERAIEELAAGMGRPCCWPGCPHREKTGKP